MIAAIETHGLTKRFADKVVLDGLDLFVAKGEVVGFLGCNGSGKTTTIRLLMGLLRPTSGHATVAGLDCQSDGPALKRLVGYLPEDPFFYPSLTGFELLEFVGGLHGFSGPEARRRAGAGVERFGLAEAAHRLTAVYSLGTRKRLALAMALLHDPQVLILDEPTNGLDPRGARDMHDLVTDFARAGKTVFLSTHLLEAAERICHRMIIVHRGRVLLAGSPAELRAHHAASADATLEDLFLRVTA